MIPKNLILPHEEWKPMPLTNGNHLISNFGRGFYIPNLAFKSKYIHSGYPFFQIENYTQKRKLLVHRLVAIAFIPNPNNKPFVNHLDGNKLNSHYSNLEWCTSKENAQHAWKTGLNKPMYRYGEEATNSKLTNNQAKEIRELRLKGVPVKKLCEIYKIKSSACYAVITNLTFKNIV